MRTLVFGILVFSQAGWATMLSGNGKEAPRAQDRKDPTCESRLVPIHFLMSELFRQDGEEERSITLRLINPSAQAVLRSEAEQLQLEVKGSFHYQDKVLDYQVVGPNSKLMKLLIQLRDLHAIDDTAKYVRPNQEETFTVAAPTGDALIRLARQSAYRLDLSLITMSFLKNETILSIGDLLQGTGWVKRMPPTQRRKLKAKLAALGLEIGMTIPGWPVLDEIDEELVSPYPVVPLSEWMQQPPTRAEDFYSNSWNGLCPERPVVLLSDKTGRTSDFALVLESYFRSQPSSEIVKHLTHFPAVKIARNGMRFAARVIDAQKEAILPEIPLIDTLGGQAPFIFSNLWRSYKFALLTAPAQSPYAGQSLVVIPIPSLIQ